MTLRTLTTYWSRTTTRSPDDVNTGRACVVTCVGANHPSPDVARTTLVRVRVVRLYEPTDVSNGFTKR